MVVGVLELSLAVPAFTLKEKRSVVKRVLNRTRQKFQVAAAEVEAMDNVSYAILGIVDVGNDQRYINSVLDHVANYVDQLGLAELVDQNIELEIF